MPKDIDSYYEDVEDLETNSKLGIRKVPSLRVDWGKNKMLNEAELANVAACMISLPPPNAKDQHKPYDYYVGGLTFLSLNDVHWQCEIQAFGNFFESLKAMMDQTGELPANASFCPVLNAFISDLFPEMDELEHFGKLFEAFERRFCPTGPLLYSGAAQGRFGQSALLSCGPLNFCRRSTHLSQPSATCMVSDPTCL
jgi:hypothetical protein